MKKKILSLFLVLATVVTLLPAMAVVSFANDEEYVPTYEDYKDLWYDDGHLVAFVDATDLSNLVINKATDNSTASGIHNYIKITGGKLAGEYYMITNEKGSLTAQGGLPAITASQTSKSTWSSSSDYKIHIGNSFAANEIAGETAIGALEGVFNPGTSEGFAIDASIKFNSASSANAGYYASIINGTSLGISGMVYSHTSPSKLFIGKYGALPLSKTAETAYGTDASVTVVSMVAYDEYSGTKVTGNASRNALMLTKDGTISCVIADNSNPNYQYHTIGTINEGDDIWAQGYGFDYRYIRIYDCAVDEEIIRQNYFADMAYFNGFDVTGFTELPQSTKSIIINEAMAHAIDEEGLKEIFDTLIADAVTEYKTSYDYYASKHLWYDDDHHLIAFLDLDNIPESEVGHSAYSAYATGTSKGVDENVHRLVYYYGETTDSVVVQNGAKSRRFTYAKIIGGENAGKWYMLQSLGNDRTFGELSEAGTITEDSMLEQMIGCQVSGKNGGYKIHIGYAFTTTDVTSGVALDTVPLDNMFKPDSEADNAYTVETVRTRDIFTGTFTTSFAYGSLVNRFIHRNGSDAAGYISYNYDGNPWTGAVLGDNSAHLADILTYTSCVDNAAGNGTKDITAIRSGMMVSNTGTVYTTKNDSSLTPVAPNATNAPALYSAQAIDGMMAGFNNGSNFYIYAEQSAVKYVRIYDVALTQEQYLQNHFADLCYHYGLNIDGYLKLGDSKLGDSYKNKLISAFASYSIGIDGTKEALQTMLDEKAQEYLSSYDYYAENGLWYDDGHLIAFIDVDNLSADQIGFTRIENGSASQLDENDRFAFYQGQTTDATITQNAGNTRYFAYFKSIGGQSAGKWYMVHSTHPSGQVTHSFGTGLRDGIYTADNLLEQFNTTNNGLYTVHLGYAFSTDEILATGTDLTKTTLHTMFVPNGQANNKFTVEEMSDIYLPVADTRVGSSALKVLGKEATRYFTASQSTYSSGTNKWSGIGANNNNASNFITEEGKNNILHAAHIVEYLSYENSILSANRMATIYNPTTNKLVHEVNSEANRYTSSAITFDAATAYSADFSIGIQYRTLNYLRLYDTSLTDAQFKQNHFADIVYMHKMDISEFATLSDVEKLGIYEFASSLEANDEGVVDLINAQIKKTIANRKAATAAALSAMSFVGYQARLHTNVGVRSVFKVNTNAISQYTVKAYGALVGFAKNNSTFSDFTVSFDGEKVTSKNASVTASVDASFKTIEGAEKEFILGKGNDSTLFAYTVDFIENGTIAKDGTFVEGEGFENHIADSKDTEMFFRAFIILEYEGCYHVAYVDGASKNYDNTSVSLAEISNYYNTYNNGEFANNVCIKAVVGNNDEE
ncbi:MAG: hypothetical protein IKA74_00095 [Clostridia bacterium]|nr:hypothetical protein [Clostridia bacterium]